jgi:hypothetical protein
MPGSRPSLFETVEKPALRPLPDQPYEFAQWRKAQANVDYHITVDKAYYSVPYQLARQEVDVRLTDTTMEILFKSKRVAARPRSYVPGRFVTDTKHMPATHQKHLNWSLARIRN